MNNPQFEGYPTVTEEDGESVFRTPDKRGETSYQTSEDAEVAVTLWLVMKYEAEHPRSLVDKLADALQERFDDL